MKDPFGSKVGAPVYREVSYARLGQHQRADCPSILGATVDMSGKPGGHAV